MPVCLCSFQVPSSCSCSCFSHSRTTECDIGLWFFACGVVLIRRSYSICIKVLKTWFFIPEIKVLLTTSVRKIMSPWGKILIIILMWQVTVWMKFFPDLLRTWSCDFLNEVLLYTAKQMVKSMKKLGHFAAQSPYLCAMPVVITWNDFSKAKFYV